MGAAEITPKRKLLVKARLYESLTEPPCSYSSTQNRKGLIRADDRVIALTKVSWFLATIRTLASGTLSPVCRQPLVDAPQ
jgi:hypothetical protein